MAKVEMARAYLALGSNVGDKIANLRAALAAIAAFPATRIVGRSAIYRTPPWGKTDQDWFGNAALGIDTALAPEALLDACLAAEAALGRVRLERWGPRIIDIDVLLHGDSRIATERLTLPHPAMHERAFVLIPLQDVAPGIDIAGERIDRVIARLDRTGIAPVGPL